MDFETTDKPKKPEYRKNSNSEKPKSHGKKVEVKIECNERQDVVNQAIFELNTAFQTLGIENWKLPKIKIKFFESKDDPVLGRVEVHNDMIEIIYDQRFSSPESERALVEKLKQTGKDYPGMQQTLKHELAHIAMWSITGFQRQPATRLIDEGWASLLENTEEDLPIKQSKKAIKQGLKEEPKLFTRCLDFSKPVSFEENLNAAEYKIGQALLLWVNEKFGKAKMIELIQKSPTPVRRNDDLTNGNFDQAKINKKIHRAIKEYSELLLNIKLGKITSEEALKHAKKWEALQFQAALLETTGFQNTEVVRKEFLKWINK